MLPQKETAALCVHEVTIKPLDVQTCMREYK